MEFDFSANMVVDALDGVPEQFRGVYVQGEGDSKGKFVVGDQFKGVVEAVSGLNKALKNERKSKPDIAKAIKSIGEDFDSPEAVRAHIEDLQGQLKALGDGKTNWDKLKKDLEAAHGRALEAKDAENRAMLGTLERYMIDNAAISAIASERGVAELLLPAIRGQVRVVKDGEEYVVRVLDEQGDARGDGKGGFMSVAQLVKEMKSHKAYGRAFESEANAGTGKTPARSTTGTQRSAADMSSVDKIGAGLAARRG